jgi:succinoglycan biosynthesis transport protein ExoP
VSALHRRWRVVALVAAFALFGAAAGILLARHDYASTATLYIPAASRVGANVGRDDLDYADRVTNTYERIAKSASLRTDVQHRLGTRAYVDVSVHPVPNTEIMELRVRAPEPALARRAANAYVDALVGRIRARDEQSQADIRGGLRKQLRGAEQALAQLRVQLDEVRDLSVRDQLTEILRLRQASYDALAEQTAIVDVAAGADRMPSVAERAEISTAKTGGAGGIALGLLLGLIAGAGVALLLERRAPQLTTLEDIGRATGASVLGTVPLAGADGQMLFNGGSAEQEAFSEMRARLLSATGNDTSAPSTLLITSPREGDGKSLIAANLAAALARAQRRVVLVDADLRDPSLHELLGLDAERGLAELLQMELKSPEVSFIQRTYVPNLSVLTSGFGSESAGELLASPRTAEVIGRLGQDHEFVVLDSPSLATASDATVLTSLVDAVVLVVGKMPASDEVVQTARRQLEGAGARRIWVVVNRWRGKRGLATQRRAVQATSRTPGASAEAPGIDTPRFAPAAATATPSAENASTVTSPRVVDATTNGSAAGANWAAPPGRQSQRRYSITVADLLEAGLLRPGDELRSVREALADVRAKVLPDGRIELDGQTHRSLAAAARATTGKKAEAGWEFWAIERDGNQVTLFELREQLPGTR